MINYDYEYLFKTDSVHKEFSITDNDSVDIGNSDIKGEDFSLTEILSDEGELTIGACCSAKIKFTTTYATDLIGKTLTVSCTPETYDPFVFGTYKVAEEKTVERQGNFNVKEVVAYDVLYDVLNANVIDWYNSLFPDLTTTKTLKQVRDSFFAYFSITQETITLDNDTMTVNKTVGDNKLSGADVLRAICATNGCFGRINRSGNFEYYYLPTIAQDLSNAYEIGINGYYMSQDHEKYTVQPIDKLIIRDDDSEEIVTVGSGDNAYVMGNNLFLYGKGASELNSIATNIYNRISGISYIPFEIDVKGDPCFEIGDPIYYTTLENETVTSYIFRREYTGVQAQRDSYSAKGEEYRDEAVNAIDTELYQLRGKSNKLERDVEQTRSTIADVALGLQTQITQTAESLEIQIQDLQSQIDGEIEYFETDTTPTLTNYPAWDFTKGIPFDGTIQFDDIYNDDMSVGGNQYPHFTYTDEVYQEHLRDLVFDKTNAVSYRFNSQKDSEGNKVWYWQEVADSETAYILQQISELKITAEELSSDMTTVEATIGNQGLQIQTNTSNISQTSSAISAEVTRATNAEGTLRSSIQATATQISAKVDKTGGTASSFAWNLQSNQFKLTSNNTDVFVCNSSGVEIKGNAKVTGQVVATSGSIGNWSISSGSITNGNVTLYSYGSIACTVDNTLKWAIHNNGNAEFHGSVTIDGYATTGSLSAVDAKFNNLNADKITTGTLSVDRLNINGLIASFRGKAVVCSSMSADYGYFTNLYKVETNVGQFGFTRRQINVGGNTIYYWGW